MSKHVTFLIGNGFDLNVGLKTRYIDFYKIYVNDNANDSNVIRRFKKEILKSEAYGWKNWMDFEMGMGQQSRLFDGETPVEDFILCFDDFVKCFIQYLHVECKKINWDAVNETFCKDFVTSVRQFYTYVRSIPSKTIQNLIRHAQQQEARLHFVQFNYTNVLDELIKKSNLSNKLNALMTNGRELNKLGKNLHVHGGMNGEYPSIGVNDESQIAHELIKNDPRIHRIFVKPKFLDALQKKDANINIPRANALTAIAESTVICTFGASMGDSDKFWWEKIGEWLRDSANVLVIFDICGNLDDGISPLAFLNSEISVEDRRKEIVERFMRLSGIDSQWLDENPNRIIVELDTKLFSFKLPMIDAKNAVSKKNEGSVV